MGFEFVGSYAGKWNVYNMYKDNAGYFCTFLASYYDSKEELLKNIKNLDNNTFIA